MTSTTPLPSGEVPLYTTEDGRARVECRFQDETVWLSQALMAEFFDRDVRTINEHLRNLFEGGAEPAGNYSEFPNSSPMRPVSGNIHSGDA